MQAIDASVWYKSNKKWLKGMVIMYLRSRRATISVRACGAPSRSTPAAAVRGSLAPLAPATVPTVRTPRAAPGWRRPTRTTTTRRRTSRSQLMWKNGKTDTRKRKENSRLTSSNQKKVSLIHFSKDFFKFLPVLLCGYCACSDNSVGRIQTKTWGEIYKSYSCICRIMTG